MIQRFINVTWPKDNEVTTPNGEVVYGVLSRSCSYCPNLIRPRVVDLSFIAIFEAKTSMHWLFDYFLRFVKNFTCYFFQKQASKDYLTQGNLLKTTLLNEKQSNLEKEMYGNISL